MFKFPKWVLFLKRLAGLSRLAGSLLLKRKMSGPERARIFFERAGAAFVKLGQILPLHHDFLPFPYAFELFKLTDKSPETPFGKMAAVFAKEKGVPVEAFFSEFNPKPAARSAIAQIYRAKLKNGAPVAVKIQRPETGKIFEIDFAVISFFAGLFDFFRVFSAVDCQEVAAGFIGWTRSELDFNFEAQNASVLREHGLSHPFSTIPKQYPELSTSRVLIQEYVAGGLPAARIFSGRSWEKWFAENGVDRGKTSANLIADAMRQYFIDGFFHADPHPANLLFLPPSKGEDSPKARSPRAGRVAYFDFGIVGRADSGRFLCLKILYGMAKKDADYIAARFMEFGRKILSEELEFYLKLDAKMRAPAEKIFKKIKELMTEDIGKEISRDLNPWFAAAEDPKAPAEEKSAANAFFKIIGRAEKYGIRLPREEILFFRALSVSDALALRLSPDFDMIKALNFFFKNHPLEDTEALIEKGTHEKEAGKKIVPLTDADWEVFREISALEKERMLAARERILDLIEHYAERYEEIRSMVKNL